MGDIMTPTRAEDLCDIIAAAAAGQRAVEIRTGGTKARMGNPRRATLCVSMSAFSRVIDYDPSELMLTVEPGVRLADINTLLDAQGQMLAFEPYDHGVLNDRPVGDATIGGIVAAAVSGPRRLSAGAVRDHLLGFQAVSGRGERFVGGAKVVKNVTGYDLPKLIAGSWGQLAIMTEITLKVMPAPQFQATLVVRCQDDAKAMVIMARALGSVAEVSAAAYLPDEAVVAFRIEGFGPSVRSRCDLLHHHLGAGDVIEDCASAALWTRIRTVAALHDTPVLWRASVPPSKGAAFFGLLADTGARRFYDWAGGLVWLGMPVETDQSAVRRAAEQVGGHAMLVRAPVALRGSIAALHPTAGSLAALNRRVKAAFDPANILDPDRFGADHAH